MLYEKAEQTFDRSRSPWVLTQVSCHWREVTLTFPKLWSFIHITSNIKERDVTRFSCPLNTLLLRSASYPLSIYIDSSVKELWDSMFYSLLTHSCWWRDIKITTQPTFFNQLAVVKGCSPLLWSAKLNIISPGHHLDFFPIIINTFKSCPMLHNVKVIDSSSPFCLIPHLPWSQLTWFSRMYAAFQHLSYLQHASNLIECYLSIDFPREPIVSLDD